MNIICFDIGGTFIKSSVINEKGDMLYKDKFPTPKANCRVLIPQSIIHKIKEVSNYFKVDAAGISSAGLVDSQKGRIIYASDNLPDYTGAEFSSVLREELNIHCCVENDVNSAALGEMWKGGAEGLESFLFISLGTGIGGAIISEGKLLRGVKGGAGEIGHMVIKENGIPCNCGGKGCFERYASTSGLLRAYKDEAGVQEINGEEFIKLVREGEATANNVYNRYLEDLATGLSNAVHILDPGNVIIGGGISAQGNSFLNDIDRAFRKKIMSSYGEYTKLHLAKLANDAGMYGVAYTALKKLSD
ncbi:MAG: ROK family protein [Clostridiaceae bacterium]